MRSLLARLKANLIDDEPFEASLPVVWFREPKTWVPSETGRGGFRITNRPDRIRVVHASITDVLTTGSAIHSFVGPRPARLPEHGRVRVPGVLRVRANIKVAFWTSLVVAAVAVGATVIATFDMLVLRGADADVVAREVLAGAGVGLALALGGLASIAFVRWLQSGQRARLEELRAPP